MKKIARSAWFILLVVFAGYRFAWAGLKGQAGPYQVEITTDPAIIPVGKANIQVKITDASGKPVEGAQVRAITKMPGMSMGEREESAPSLSGQRGVYKAFAAFPMAGDYTTSLKITASQGTGTLSIPLQTGQNTAVASGSGRSLMDMWPWVIGLAIAVFVLCRSYRIRENRLDLRVILNRQVLAGLSLLAIMLAISIYAVRHFRRQGAMTPMEAQAMDMSLPAPPGFSPVELATVQRGRVDSEIRYSGQAVGYVEIDVYPRVQGIMTWMPFYVGNRVRKGQLLARLDTSQTAPQVAERKAAADVAEQGTAIARSEYRESLSTVDQAEAELGIRRGAVREARSQLAKAKAEVGAKRAALQEVRAQERKTRYAVREAQSGLQAARETLTESTSDLAAAREERSNAAADADEAQAQVPDAQAQLQAAQADLDYWSAEIDRMRVLLKEGAVSRDEFQREQAQAESAAAKVRQGQAGVAQARARVRGAQSRVRKADAMIQSAVAKTNQSQAQIKGHQARIEQANAEVDAASARVQQAAADIRVAQTEVNAANSRVGQANSELEAHHAHVGQAEAASAAAGQRIAQAQAGAKQARAGLAGAVATQGYTEIRSQIDGIVIQRFISPGVLVSPGQAILRVAQLNPIRLQANVTESDLNRIAVGSPATVYDQEGKHSLAARVTSITPAVDPVSRTGIVEAVVSNAKGWFSPGQYVVMKISIGRSVGGLRIPTRAIQWRTPPSGGVVSTNRVPYVWVATSTAGTVGQFTVEQVDVRVGLSDAHYTEILAGLKERQRVVVTGQQNLRNGDLVSSANAASTTMDDDTGNKSGLESHNMAVSPKVSVAPAAPSAIQSATITVTDQGFEPAHLTLRHGVPARLTFLRKTDATCATEVVIPDYHIKKALPLNQPVVVEITPRKAGSFTFSCGMNMLHGQVVVQ